MLDFDFIVPKWKIMDLLRWHVPLPRFADLRSNAVGLRHKGEYLIKGMCPPYYDSMSEAVDAVVAEKFGPHVIYRDRTLFQQIYKGEFGDRYLAEASDYRLIPLTEVRLYIVAMPV